MWLNLAQWPRAMQAAELGRLKCHRKGIGWVRKKSNPNERGAWHNEGVDMHSRKQYLLEIGKEYEQTDMEGRGRLLDDA